MIAPQGRSRPSNIDLRGAAFVRHIIRRTTRLLLDRELVVILLACDGDCHAFKQANLRQCLLGFGCHDAELAGDVLDNLRWETDSWCRR